MLKASQFSKILSDWYQLNKRSLPWRETRDPYLIWLSEIILQQTRVNQGLSYYKAFAKRFPTVKKLANAEEEQVLKLWQGLGYYSRARNLHAAAQQIMKEYSGKFPKTFDEIITLKGVGIYTASAISSFAFDEAKAVVDGNVYRVLSRLYGIDAPIDSTEGKKYFQELAEKLLDKKNPAVHNQAIMEFGALHCTPSSPDCNNCVFNTECMAFLKGNVSSLPVKQKRTKQRARYFNYLVIQNGNIICLEKREAKDVWQNLYQFPLIESTEELTAKMLKEHKEWKKILGKGMSFKMKGQPQKMEHILSHQRIYASFWELETPKQVMGYLSVHRKDINNYPLSRLIERFVEGN